MKVTAILASHNRRDRTLACLASYYAQAVATSVEQTAVLVDDGSSDETAEAVRERFPLTEVLLGDGHLFWAAAMARAEKLAAGTRPDYLLWLNDDVVLDRDALSRLIHTAKRHADASIVVGALRDPQTGRLTYSGLRHRGPHPLRMDIVEPGDQPVEVETFNGNVVLVPRAAVETIGSIDGAFAHGAADFDYGLRARRLGIPSVLAPGTVGGCPPNNATPPWLDASRSVREGLSALVGPKGIPPRSTARYLKRHGGHGWMLFWVGSYVRAAWSIARLPRHGGTTR